MRVHVIGGVASGWAPRERGRKLKKCLCVWFCAEWVHPLRFNFCKGASSASCSAVWSTIKRLLLLAVMSSWLYRRTQSCLKFQSHFTVSRVLQPLSVDIPRWGNQVYMSTPTHPHPVKNIQACTLAVVSFTLMSYLPEASLWRFCHSWNNRERRRRPFSREHVCHSRGRVWKTHFEKKWEELWHRRAPGCRRWRSEWWPQKKPRNSGVRRAAGTGC